jgi:8-oxo-dGTP diphosphatase
MGETERPSIRVVSAEVQRDGKFLIIQRPSNAVLPMLWEFPGGRVHEHETDALALVRAARTRIGVDLDVDEMLLEVVHHYPDYTVTLAVYRASIGAQEPWPDRVAALAWVAPEDFENYPFPAADQETIQQLLEHPLS